MSNPTPAGTRTDAELRTLASGLTNAYPPTHSEHKVARAVLSLLSSKQEAERDAREITKAYVQARSDQMAAESALADCQAQVAVAMGALERFGVHGAACKYEPPVSYGPCDCGLADVTESLRSSPSGALRDLIEKIDELLTVAALRGDDILPHPADDPKLWTARMQSAWDDLVTSRAALRPFLGETP